MTKRIHAFVSGTVQGVFFRSFVRSEARLLRITGWVKNISDGRVELVAEGDSDRIDDFVDRLKQGPTAAKVNDVNLEIQKPSNKFTEFSIR